MITFPLLNGDRILDFIVSVNEHTYTVLRTARHLKNRVRHYVHSDVFWTREMSECTIFSVYEEKEK